MTTNDPEVWNTDNKLEAMLQLSHGVTSLSHDCRELINHRLKAQPTWLTDRDRVILGMGLKIYRSLQALIRDAEARRLESMHHLKTLVETFIYLRWAANDHGNTRARLLIAGSCKNKIKFFEKNSDSTDASLLNAWKESFTHYTKGIETDWDNFKNMKIETIAGEVGAGMPDWYRRAYKFACEPAHLTDLNEHMPKSDGLIDLGQPKTALFYAVIALDYGLHVMLSVIGAASREYGLGVEQKLKDFEFKLRELRNSK